MRVLDRVVGLTVTMASALASTGLVVWIIREPATPGDVTWPWLLAATLFAINAWIGVWAWANEHWLVAAPTVFLGALGSIAMMSFLALIPMGFAGMAFMRAIRHRVRTV